MVNNEIIGRGWTFPVGPDGSGRLSLSAGTEDIDESISLILGTSLGERVMRPNFGCRIHDLVYAPIHGNTLGLAERYVREALGWWEPRIQVRDVAVRADQDAVDLGRLLILITYQVRSTKDERTLVYPFYLIREE
ncbi:MAG: GPW/gp25 family protein [Tepidiformaceae bacterium]